MATTMLKIKKLKFPQIKLSIVSTYNGSHPKFGTIMTAQQYTSMKSAEIRFYWASLSNYGELPTLLRLNFRRTVNLF